MTHKTYMRIQFEVVSTSGRFAIFEALVESSVISHQTDKQDNNYKEIIPASVNSIRRVSIFQPDKKCAGSGELLHPPLCVCGHELPRGAGGAGGGGVGGGNGEIGGDAAAMGAILGATTTDGASDAVPTPVFNTKDGLLHFFSASRSCGSKESVEAAARKEFAPARLEGRQQLGVSDISAPGLASGGVAHSIPIHLPRGGYTVEIADDQVASAEKRWQMRDRQFDRLRLAVYDANSDSFKHYSLQVPAKGGDGGGSVDITVRADNVRLLLWVDDPGEKAKAPGGARSVVGATGCKAWETLEESGADLVGLFTSNAAVVRIRSTDV